MLDSSVASRAGFFRSQTRSMSVERRCWASRSLTSIGRRAAQGKYRSDRTRAALSRTWELASSTAQQAGQEHLAWLLVDQQRLNFSRLRLRSGARRLAGLPEAAEDLRKRSRRADLTLQQGEPAGSVALRPSHSAHSASSPSHVSCNISPASAHVSFRLLLCREPNGRRWRARMVERGRHHP